MIHQSLKYIFSTRSKLNACTSRTQIKLQGYDFIVVYKKRSTNITDYLKCKADDDGGIVNICLCLNDFLK